MTPSLGPGLVLELLGRAHLPTATVMRKSLR